MTEMSTLEAKSSPTEAVTQVEGAVGMLKPFCYILNYQNHAYAKFQYNQQCINAFEQKLGQIEDSLTRK